MKIDWNKKIVSTELTFRDVTIELPNKSEAYLVRCDNACMSGTVKQFKVALFIEHHQTWILDSFDGEVTHWATLPIAE